MKSKQGMKR